MQGGIAHRKLRKTATKKKSQKGGKLECGYAGPWEATKWGGGVGGWWCGLGVEKKKSLQAMNEHEPGGGAVATGGDKSELTALPVGLRWGGTEVTKGQSSCVGWRSAVCQQNVTLGKSETAERSPGKHKPRESKLNPVGRTRTKEGWLANGKRTTMVKDTVADRTKKW